jgi:hypothetical protein
LSLSKTPQKNPPVVEPVENTAEKIPRWLSLSKTPQKNPPVVEPVENTAEKSPGG